MEWGVLQSKTVHKKIYIASIAFGPAKQKRKTSTAAVDKTEPTSANKAQFTANKIYGIRCNKNSHQEKANGWVFPTASRLLAAYSSTASATRRSGGAAWRVGILPAMNTNAHLQVMLENPACH